MKKGLSIREIAVFAMLGALMFGSKKLMEFVPNIHPLAMLTMVYTLAYRWKGIVPVLVYLVLDTVVAGGITWVVPYWYIFPLIWLCTLAIPKSWKGAPLQIACTVLCTLFGLLFGVLYAPWQAVMFGLNFEKTLAWIAAGFTFDILHAIGNFAGSFLILPLARLLKRIQKKA